MQCIEQGCEAPQHYPVTQRCLLHSIEFTATPYDVLRSTTPVGQCRVPGCTVPAPIPQRGKAPIHCPEHTRAWNVARNASQRRRKEATRVSALVSGVVCASCGEAWALDPVLNRARVPRFCPSCRSDPGFYPKRSRHLLRNYGLGPGEYETRLQEQGGLCAICRIPTDRRLHVDHDHSCCPTNGKSCGRCVRGLLCSSCNTGLGSFRDSPTTLQAAVAYLASYTQEPTTSTPV